MIEDIVLFGGVSFLVAKSLGASDILAGVVAALVVLVVHLT